MLGKGARWHGKVMHTCGLILVRLFMSLTYFVSFSCKLMLSLDVLFFRLTKIANSLDACCANKEARMTDAVESAACLIGSNRAVCRGQYIHKSLLSVRSEKLSWLLLMATRYFNHWNDWKIVLWNMAGWGIRTQHLFVPDRLWHRKVEFSVFLISLDKKLPYFQVNPTSFFRE